MKKINCIYLAAGIGKRLGLKIPKQLIRLGGKPIMLYSLEELVKSNFFDKIIVTYVESVLDEYKNIISQYFIDKLEFIYVKGGETRQESVYNAVRYATSERVLIHEASRPFITKNMLNTVLTGKGDCIVPVIDIPFTVAGGKEYMTQIFERDKLKNIQLPQVFNTKVLKNSHEMAKSKKFTSTDDSTIAFHFGYNVKFVPGSETNIKITTPSDLLLAEKILFSRDLPSE